ncbi:AraC family transcriptional regulator [Microbacterium sp. 179-I 3D3 NHS]|uniref:AraC family transcriptional regulator n=1 Tax=Microbacterium sp. 179-I 3D3 NHS TaxID=3142382 RepID=UPI0039A37DD3
MRFRTREVSRVEETWRQYVPSAVLHRVDRDPFQFDWHSIELGGVSLVHYTLSAEVHSTAEPHDQFLACRVSGAKIDVRSARKDLDAGRPWISDGTKVHAHWDGNARVTALVLDHGYLEGVSRQISGDDDLSLSVAELTPHNAEAAASWSRMFTYVERAAAPLRDGDTLLRSELARHAAVTTLASFATTMPHRDEHAEQTTAAPGTVRRAREFIAANAHLPITVDDIANAVHISTRGLQYAFRRALDITPAEALRQARLDGAHRELRFGSPATVAAVGRRWGFAHPSRFARAYREAFGISPSETLRKSRP